jgi:hypothetical protein
LGFHSQTFSKPKQNYPIYDRELLAVIRGLRCWRHLLRNTSFPVLVITDHANLQYYREPQKIGPCVNGYIAELADYHIQLVYKPGATNRADGLSWRPDMVPDEEDELVIVLPDHLFVHPDAPTTKFTTTRMKPEDYDSDDTLVEEIPKISEKARTAHLDNGHTMSAYELDRLIIDTQTIDVSTMRRWRVAHSLQKMGELWTKEGALVVVGNNDLKRGVISLFHDSPTAGHPGITKTLSLTKVYYWWPNMKNFIMEYIKGCTTCQMAKINTHLTKPALFPITVEPNALPFETIALDFIVKLPESNSFDSILTITDHDCSKAAIFIPCNETIDAIGTAWAYATHVFPHYGLPKKVISDRDLQFASNVIRELCAILGIKQNISSAYHPQTDGQSERTNQSLEQYLRLYCGTQQNQWADWLPIAQYTRNAWPNATTKKTPFELIMGYVPKAHQPSRQMDIPDVDQRMKRIKEARTATQDAINKSQNTLQKETKFKGYAKGSKVWLEGTNINRPYQSKKLSPKRYGPFRVVTQISKVAYKLQIPPTWQIHDVFHASLLTPYKETEEHGTNFIEPPPEEIEGEERYKVEQVIDERDFGRNKKKQYLVRWKGYAPAHDQWVDEKDLDAPELIAQYLQKRLPRRSIRTLRKKQKMAIRSLQLSPYQSIPTSMSQNVPTTPVLQEQHLSEEDYDLARAAAIEAATSPRINLQAELIADFILTPIGGGLDVGDRPSEETSLPTNHEPSPPLLPTPPRHESQTHDDPRTGGSNVGLLDPVNPGYDRTSPEALRRLWSQAKALGEFHAEQGKYPVGIFAPGILHTFGIIKTLIDLAEPPSSLAQFMSHLQQQQRLDVRLGTALATVLDDIRPYLLKGKGLLHSHILEPPIDSRDDKKELAYPIDSRDDVKELTVDS